MSGGLIPRLLLRPSWTAGLLGSRPRRVLFFVGSVTLFSIAVLSLRSRAGPQSPCEQFSYAAIVDAGSTGSRIHLFGWQNGDLSSPSYLGSKKTSPGIADYASNAETLAAIGPLIDFAEQSIRPEFHVCTRLMLMATGGMRKLSWEDAQTRIDYLRVGLSYGAKAGKTLRVRRKADVRILTGAEEAVFGFLSVNSYVPRTDPVYGVVELGGESVQWTFPLRSAASTADSGDDVASATPDEDVVAIPRKGVGFAVPVQRKSIMGWGMFGAFRRLQWVRNPAPTAPTSGGALLFVRCGVVRPPLSVV